MSLTKKGFFKLILLILFLGLIVGWLGFGERGFVHLHKMDKEREAYIEKISRLEQEKQSLLDEIKRLRTDKEHIESIARREWGLIKDNEILYRFAKEKEDVPSSRRVEESKPTTPPLGGQDKPAAERSRKIQRIRAQGSKPARLTAEKTQNPPN